MMKNDNSKKITALGVVIFSFLAIAIMIAVTAIFGALSAILVLKTELPESVLKIGNVLGAGLGAIASAAFLTAAGKVKGIVATAIIFFAEVMIKCLGNIWMGLGGYFTMNGLIGILFVLLFSFVGGVIGGMVKKR